MTKSADSASFHNVYVSIVNYNQSLDQQPIRVGEKYLFPHHTHFGRYEQREAMICQQSKPLCLFSFETLGMKPQ